MVIIFVYCLVLQLIPKSVGAESALIKANPFNNKLANTSCQIWEMKSDEID